MGTTCTASTAEQRCVDDGAVQAASTDRTKGHAQSGAAAICVIQGRSSCHQVQHDVAASQHSLYSTVYIQATSSPKHTDVGGCSTHPLATSWEGTEQGTDSVTEPAQCTQGRNSRVRTVLAQVAPEERVAPSPPGIIQRVPSTDLGESTSRNNWGGVVVVRGVPWDGLGTCTSPFSQDVAKLLMAGCIALVASRVQLCFGWLMTG